MDKKRRARYQIAVYGIVGALGIILVFMSLVFKWLDVWQSIWINLGTGLIGVGILFFLVDRFFLADEWGLSDRIDQLIRRLEVSDRPSAEAFFSKPPELDDYFKTAVEIDLCGMSLTGTLNKHFGAIRERLQAGAAMRVLLANPNSLALEMSAQRSEAPDDVDYYVKRLASAFKDLGYLFQARRDNRESYPEKASQEGLSVRLLSYAPSFGIQRFKANSGDQTIVVEIYPHRGGFTTPPVFILRPERDKRWYDYFAEQFEQMWERAVPWDPQTRSEDMEQLLQHRIGHARAGSFLSSKRYLPEQLLASAHTIHMSGFTLGRTTREYQRFLERCIMTGGTVQVMILETTDLMLDQCVKRSGGQSGPEYWRIRLDSTKSLLDVIAKMPEVKGTLSLGLLPYIPSYGLIMIDPDTDHGVIAVELYHHRSSDDNPTFELRANRDGDWYKFFRKQFDLMWESCRVEKLPRRDNPEDTGSAPGSTTATRN